MSARAAVKDYLNAEIETLKADVSDLIVIPYPATLEQLEGYVRASNWSLIAWESCIQFIERYTSDNKSLPQPLAEFALNAIRKSRSKPSRRGRSRYSNLPRNFLLVEAVRRAISAGLKPTRNRYSKNPNNSACDVVAECLQEFGIYLSYDAVEKVWNTRVPDTRSS